MEEGRFDSPNQLDVKKGPYLTYISVLVFF